MLLPGSLIRVSLSRWENPNHFLLEHLSTYLDSKVTLTGTSLQPERIPKILNFHFYSFNFTRHARKTTSKALSRLHTFKLLLAPRGHSRKRTFDRTEDSHKVRDSKLHPVWFSNASRSSSKASMRLKRCFRGVSSC